MKHRSFRFFPPLLAGAVLLTSVGALFFSGCAKNVDGPSPAGGTQKSLIGTWYEQELNGGVLVVTEKKLTYTHYDYTFEVNYKTKKSGGKIEVIPDDEYWVYIDILYDPEEDVLTGHDLPHTDGDGGYHLHTFLKTEYVAPPPPVYGERTDNTDPDAPKEFADYTVKTLSLKVMEPRQDSGDMAPEEPDQGYYEYELTVGEDGAGTLASDFCRTVPFGEEKQAALSELLAQSALATLNGLDVWTEEMPEDTPYYELSIGFADGETFSSRANGPDVSAVWETDGRTLHKFLFDTFVEAGYNPWSGEFHTTDPMKRIGRPDDFVPRWQITKEPERIERTGTAYPYEIHSEYPVFTAEGDAPEALMETLNALTEDWKEQAERDLEEMDAVMAGATKSDRKKSDRWYAYSFYAPERISSDDLLLKMFVSEGHANSLGLGPYDHGYYPNWRYNIDPRTGKILSAADFFNDADALEALVLELLCRQYSSESSVAFFRSEEQRAVLHDALTKPESEGGVGVVPGYGSLDLYFEHMEKDENGDSRYPYQLQIWYEDVQDLLNDDYMSEW